MLVFLTLFLGLVGGVHLVEVAASDPAIITVEYSLDGEMVAVLHEAPWSIACDFGDRLTPHELVAVGRDQRGEIVAEVRQWINLPRDRAELEILLEDGEQGLPRRGRLVWSSVDAARPETVQLTFDGAVLGGWTWPSFDLPPYDATVPHLLQAEVIAPGGSVRAQSVVGGGGGEAVSRELTAILVELESKAKEPTAAEMEGWFSSKGVALPVVALERPGADVVMVQDLDWTVQGLLNRLRQEMLAPSVSARNRPSGLKFRDEFRILFPIPEVTGDAKTPSVQFPQSPNLWSGKEQETFSQGAGRRQIATPIPQGLLVAIPVNAERRIDTTQQSLADAAAAAGLVAVAGRRGRAVIVVAGSETPDHSRWRPEQVRSYLADLQVLLRVWSPVPSLVDPGWGEVESITNRPQLTRAIREFREALDRQVVVWLEGRVLPQEVEVSSAARGVLVPLASGQLAQSQQIREESLDEEDAAGEHSAEESPAEVAEVAPALPATAPGPPEHTPPGPAVEAGFGESTEVRLATVEVVVTDRNGELVLGLGEGDFSLEVDGAAMPIEFLEPPAPVRGQLAAAPVNPSAPRPIAAADGALAIYLDLPSLDRAQRGRVFDSLRATLAAAPPRPTLIAVHDRGLELVAPLSGSPQALATAIDEVAKRPVALARDPAVDVLNEMGRVQEELDSAHRIRDETERRMAVESALAQRSMVEMTLQSFAEQRRREVLEVLAGIEGVLTSLIEIEGPRALLYVGDRLSATPAEEVFEAAGEGMVDHSSLAREILRTTEDTRQANLLGEGRRFGVGLELDRVMVASRDAGVAFYSLGPAGLDDGAAISSTSAGAPGSRGRSARTREAAARSASCGLAEETAGLCQNGGTNVAGFFAEVAADLDSAYTIGFRPSFGNDGGRHQVRVQVSRPATKLRYRESYRAPGGTEDGTVRLRARLNSLLMLGGAAENPLDLRIELGEQSPTQDPEVRLVKLRVRVPVASLVMSPSAATEQLRGVARLVVQSLDSRGRSAGAQEFPVQFEVPSAQLASQPGLLYEHAVHLQLRPGTHVVGVGWWDEAARLGSLVRIEVEVP